MTEQRKRNMAAEGHPVGATEFTGGTPASDGWHHAVLAEVVDLGMDFTFNKAGQHRGAMVFVLDELTEGGNFAGQNKEAVFWFDYDNGLGSHAKGTKLKAFLESWRGTPFTEQEMIGFKTKLFQLQKLVGRSLRLFIVVEKAKTSDKLVAKVMKAAKAEVKMQVPDSYRPWHSRSQQQQQPARQQQARQQATGGATAGFAGWGEGDDEVADHEPWDADGAAQADDDDIPFVFDRVRNGERKRREW